MCTRWSSCSSGSGSAISGPRPPPASLGPRAPSKASADWGAGANRRPGLRKTKISVVLCSEFVCLFLEKTIQKPKNGSLQSSARILAKVKRVTHIESMGNTRVPRHTLFLRFTLHRCLWCSKARKMSSSCPPAFLPNRQELKRYKGVNVFPT